MARILSVVWYKIFPPLFGGQKGIAEFNEHLSGYHDLTCICSRNNVVGNTHYEVVPILPVRKLQVLNPVAWKQILDAVRTRKITHLLLEHCYYGLTGMVYRKLLKVRLIIHAHNIESLRFRQEGRWWWPLLWLLEKKTLQHADLVLFKTPDDQHFAMTRWRVPLEKTLIVPFGLNRDSNPSDMEKKMARKLIRERHQLREEEKILLFAGTLDFEPNARAVQGIVEKLIPMLHSRTNELFRIIVCGRLMDPAYQWLLELHHPGYLYAGLVDDIEPYMLAADVFLNPVSGGGGIKVKSLEALSFNLPVVCFEHSAKGIDPATVGSKLMVCSDDNWEDLAMKSAAAFHDTANTPDAFFQAYQWKDIAGQVAGRISSL